MRVRDFYASEANELDAFWKYQLSLGVLLVLLGICIVLFPHLLAVMVATAIIVVGATLIASGWRFRRLRHRYEDFSNHEVFEW